MSSSKWKVLLCSLSALINKNNRKIKRSKQYGKIYLSVRLSKIDREETRGVRLAISDKKLFRGRRNRRNNWFVPAELRLFRGTENSRNSVPNHSAEEKNARNSFLWNKNRNNLSEFRSKPFRGRENNSEFHSMEQK
jgi:hypothetical protein